MPATYRKTLGDLGESIAYKKLVDLGWSVEELNSESPEQFSLFRLFAGLRLSATKPLAYWRVDIRSFVPSGSS